MDEKKKRKIWSLFVIAPKKKKKQNTQKFQKNIKKKKKKTEISDKYKIIKFHNNYKNKLRISSSITQTNNIYNKYSKQNLSHGNDNWVRFRIQVCHWVNIHGLKI